MEIRTHSIKRKQNHLQSLQSIIAIGIRCVRRNCPRDEWVTNFIGYIFCSLNVIIWITCPLLIASYKKNIKAFFFFFFFTPSLYIFLKKQEGERKRKMLQMTFFLKKK